MLSFEYAFKLLSSIERHPAPFVRALGPRGELTTENYGERVLGALDVVLGPGTAAHLALGIRRLPGRQQARMIRRLRLVAVRLLTATAQ